MPGTDPGDTAVSKANEASATSSGAYILLGKKNDTRNASKMIPVGMKAPKKSKRQSDHWRKNVRLVKPLSEGLTRQVKVQESVFPGRGNCV